jgi:hypothetical protein
MVSRPSATSSRRQAVAQTQAALAHERGCDSTMTRSKGRRSTAISASSSGRIACASKKLPAL